MPENHDPLAARSRLREAALKNKPWLQSTGPKTPEGKARAAQNGRHRQMDAMSRREIQAEVGELNALLTRMAASRQAIIDEEKTETTASM